MSITDKAAALASSIRGYGNAVGTKTETLNTDKQPLIPAGEPDEFYAGNKNWADFGQFTRSVVLTNVSMSSAVTITESDTVLEAFGKIQAQLNQTSLGGHTHDDRYVLLTSVGAANGVAALGSDGKIPSTQLPSYVDDVLEYPNFAGLPAAGEQGKVYVTVDNNRQYRWSGSIYVQVTSGAVDSVAGKTGVVTLIKSDVGLGNVDNTADSVKNVLSASKFTTARTIAGVSFDGTTNIAIPFANLSATPTTLAGYNISDAQPLKSVLTSLGDLSTAATGLVKLTNGVASLDSSTYLTANQTINITGDATGSGKTDIALTLSNTGVAAGTYNNNATAITPLAIDAKGRIISTGPTVTITPAWSSITSKPTTLAGYNITDATPLTHVGTGGSAHSTATALSAGFMSPADKSKLDGVETGAQVNTVTSVASKTGAVTLNSSDVGLGNVENKTSATIRSELTSTNVTTALGYTPYNATNPNGYITSSASITGNAATTTKLQTARSISMTGDVAWSIAAFDGSTNVTAAATLTDTGVSAGTYLDGSTQIRSFTVDSKGRITAVGPLTTITPDWSSIANKPSSLSGYGIMDAVAKANAVFEGAITEKVYDIVDANPTISPTNGTLQTWTLSASSAPDFVTAPGQYLTLLVQTGASYTVTWPGSIVWVGGTAPQISTTGKTMLTFWNIGGVLYGAKVGDVA